MKKTLSILLAIVSTFTIFAEPLTCYIDPPYATGDCQGTTFTVIPNGGVPPYRILWQDSKGIIAEGPTVIIVNSGFYVATTFDAVKNNNSCGIYVEGPRFTNSSVTITPQSLEICAGQIAKFKAVSSGAEPLSFLWTGPNNFSSTNSHISVVAIPQAAGIYSVSVSDNSECIRTAFTQLIVSPVVTCWLTPDPALICSGETLSFTINPEGGTPPFTFMWWGPNGFFDTNQTTTVSVEGFYIGSIRDSRGCNNSDSVYLHVLECGNGNK